MSKTPSIENPDLDFYKEKMNALSPTPDDMRIFWVGSDIARIEARTTYILECIMEGSGIIAALDDMAQIIGYEAKLVNDNEKEIIGALMESSAVLVKPTSEIKEEYSIWERGYAITTGRDPYEAYVALTVLEKAAEVQIKGRAIGGVKTLGKGHAKGEHRNYLYKYSAPGIERRAKIKEGLISLDMDPADDVLAEFKGRSDLVTYGKKLVENNLVQGSWGNLSVRQDEDEMLVTPSGLDYNSVSPEDMVRMNINTLEVSKAEEDAEPARGMNNPTTEKKLHAGIYRERPEIKAVVHTHSKFCSILAACQMPLEVKEEGLRNTLGELILTADYGEAGSDKLTSNVLKALGNRPGCIMANHGMAAVGGSLEEAFDIAMAMEDAARRLVNEYQLKKADSMRRENI